MGVPLDVGASWIHGVTGNPLSGLSDSVGAERAATSYESALARDAEGQVVPLAELPSDFEDVTSVEHELGAEVGVLSSQAFEEGEEYRGGDVIFSHGCVEVVEALVEGFTVETGWIVEQVDATGGSVAVTSSAG